MVARRTVSLVLVLLVMPLTGCLGGSDGTETQPTSQANGTTPGGTGRSPAATDANATLAYRPAELDATVLWRNGSFSTQESCLGGGCLTYLATGNDTTQHTVDLTERIPPGVPARIEAQASHGTGPGGSPTATMSLLLATPATVYTEDGSSGIAGATLNATLARTSDQAVLLNVSAGLAEPDGTEYTLRVQVEPMAGSVPSAVPTAVTLSDQDQGVVASGPEDRETTLMAWGPDDSFLGTYNVTGRTALGLPNGSGPGAYVLLVGGQEANVTLSAPGGGTLEVLDLRIELGEPHEATGPPGDLTWSFQPSGVPLAAGFYVRFDPGAGIYTPWSGQVRSPHGPVAEAWTGGIGLNLDSPNGDGTTSVHLGDPADPDLAHGTYEGSFEHNGTARVSVGGAWLTYER